MHRSWRHRLTSGGITLLYAGFASFWIIASDGLLSLFIDEPSLLVRLSVIKGIAFVVVTASLLYLLLRVWIESRTVDYGGPAITPTPGWRSLILVFLGLALLPVLLGVGIVRLHGPQLEREAYENLRAIADLKASQITRWLLEQQKDGEALMSDPGFSRAVDQFFCEGGAIAE